MGYGKVWSGSQRNGGVRCGVSSHCMVSNGGVWFGPVSGTIGAA